MMRKIPHTIQVTSFGGSGTSMLIDFFKLQGIDVSADHDSGEWKHLPTPQTTQEYKIPANFRAVYLLSDPVDALISVFRRKYHTFHAERMQSTHLWPDGFLDTQPNRTRWGLREFVALKRDCFGIEKQFTAWTGCPYEKRKYPIMILKYDCIWESLTRIGDFVGLTTLQMSQFPEKTPRKEPDAESELYRGDLERLYGNLRSMVAARPNCDVV